MVKGKLAVVCFISHDDVIKIVYTIQITTVHLQSGQGLGEGMNYGTMELMKAMSTSKKKAIDINNNSIKVAKFDHIREL